MRHKRSRFKIKRPERPPVDAAALDLAEKNVANATLARQIRTAIKRREKEFNEALNQTRPVLDSKIELRSYSEAAAHNGRMIAKYVLQVMSLQTAVNYAEAMVTQDMAGDGIRIDTAEFLHLARRMFRIKAAKLVAKHFNLSDIETRQIVYNLINRDFPLVRSGSTQPQAPVANYRSALEQAYTAGTGDRLGKAGKTEAGASERKHW